MKFFIVLVLLLQSCGSSNDSGSTDSRVTKEETGVATSYYVDSDDQLVTCDNSRKGYLAYIKKSDQFKACVDGGWTAVNVKGKDGKDGTASTVQNIAPDTTVWKDPNTGKSWKVYGYTKYGPVSDGAFTAICNNANNLYVPTTAEIALASANGLYIAFQGFGSSYQNMWDYDAASSGFRRYDALNLRFTAAEPGSNVGSPQALFAATVCVTH